MAAFLGSLISASAHLESSSRTEIAVIRSALMGVWRTILRSAPVLRINFSSITTVVARSVSLGVLRIIPINVSVLRVSSSLKETAVTLSALRVAWPPSQINAPALVDRFSIMGIAAIKTVLMAALLTSLINVLVQMEIYW